MIPHAMLVLSVPEDARRCLKVLPDLQDLGLREATLLHILPGGPGPAEPMPELANWVRTFEASLERVDLALKRGNAVRWISELARVRRTHLVVLSTPPSGRSWDVDDVSSPLRELGIPILYLPERDEVPSLVGDVVIAVKNPDTLITVGPELGELLGPDRLQAVRVVREPEGEGEKEIAGIRLEPVSSAGEVAETLLGLMSARDAGLLTLMKAETPVGSEGESATTKRVLEATEWPVLLWVPGAGS